MKDQGKQQRSVQDYRVTIFLLLTKAFKALKLFGVQKVVRKIRANEKPDKLPEYEQNLKELKQLSATDFRKLAYFLMAHQLKLLLEPQSKFFSKEVPQVDLITKDFLINHQALGNFQEAIKGQKKYTQTMEKVQELLQFVEKKKEKTKLMRVIKKKKFVLKQQNKLEPVTPQQQITESQGLMKNEITSTKSEKKSQSVRPIKQNNITKRQATNSIGNGRNVQQKQQQLTEEKKPDFSFANLHPSWQAKIEQKQMIGNLSLFQGKKIRLC